MPPAPVCGWKTTIRTFASLQTKFDHLLATWQSYQALHTYMAINKWKEKYDQFYLPLQGRLLHTDVVDLLDRRHHGPRQAALLNLASALARQPNLYRLFPLLQLLLVWLLLMLIWCAMSAMNTRGPYGHIRPNCPHLQGAGPSGHARLPASP